MATKHDYQMARARTLRNRVQLYCHEAAQEFHERLDREAPDHDVPFSRTYRQALEEVIADLTGGAGVERREACWQVLMQVTRLNPSLDEHGEPAEMQPSKTTRNLTLELLGDQIADLTRIS